ncbi:MAG TPA: N-acetylmuramoyl-L-alanine amidase [Trueperaceae bacterium]
MKRLAPLLLLLLAAVASAQSLSVNGYEVPGLNLSLVEGVSYAPATAYAEALGASMTVDYGSGLVGLELGGRLVLLPTFTEIPEEGAYGFWQVNGEPRRARAAVFDDGVLFLPVAAVANALLGYTTYVPESDSVMVVLPRGRVESLDARRRGDSDRIVLTLSSNVPYALFYNEPVSSLELRFDRTESSGITALDDGRYFRRATVLDARGDAELRVVLEEDVDYSVYTVPDGRGYQLVVDLFPAQEEEVAQEPPPRVVINAAHGGDDRGMAVARGSESGQTLALSSELAEELRRRGLAVELTRREDHDLPLASRSGSGVGADLFLSLHVHPTPDGVISLYYLEEADGAAGLDMAVRQNAEEELQGSTDELRRRLLLNLVPDVEVGRRYAEGLRGELFASGGFLVAEPEPAPLAILAGAAGRGLLIELPAELTSQDASRQELVDTLAGAVATLLMSDEAGR